MRPFEELRIWQDAQETALAVYALLKDNKDYGFRDQIQRAAISISNNIAEGSGYNSDRTMIRYLKIARGSYNEVRNMLYLCPKLGYCSDETAMELNKKNVNHCLMPLVPLSHTSKIIKGRGRMTKDKRLTKVIVSSLSLTS